MPTLYQHDGSRRLFRHTVFIGSELVVKGISRSREFHADAVGATVSSNEAMIRALERVYNMGEKPTAEERQYGYIMFRGMTLGNFFSTHPTLNARVRALGARTQFQTMTDDARRKAGVTSVDRASPQGLRLIEQPKDAIFI